MRSLQLRFSTLFIVAAACLAILANAAAAQDTTRGVRIGLVYANGTKPGVLVLPINGEHGDSVRAILQRDFDFSDRINVIAPDSIITDSTGGNSRGQYNYPLFAKLGAAAMLQATLTPSSLHVAVHNVGQQKIERVKDFPLDGAPETPDWRMSLHAVADEVELWLTPGGRGIAATRILYVDDSKRAGRVWQIDSDGANPTPLTPAVEALSPAWHPKATHIAYAVLTNDGYRLMLREVGGATRSLTLMPGQNSSPVFSPDGSTLLYAHISDSGTDIYAVNPFASDPPRRITVGRGVFDNLSPTFSPDGRRIAFTSTKSGHPEVYIADADGTNAEILTSSFGDASYQTDPDWSPDGRLIAFQSKSKQSGDFQIVTIGLADHLTKRLTSEGQNENPSFSPDSRHIVFTSDRTGVHQLFVLDVETARVRQLTHSPGGAKHAAWSPLLRGR
jgi:TolB protein